MSSVSTLEIKRVKATLAAVHFEIVFPGVCAAEPTRVVFFNIDSIQGGGGRVWEQTNSSVSGGTIFTQI